MPRAVALLRGVGGPTALRMPALREALTSAGLRDVVTLQVAGNIVTDAGGRTPDELAALVCTTVRTAFGHDLAVMVRSHDELADAQARNPFAGTHEGRWVQTVFLDGEAPRGAGRASLRHRRRVRRRRTRGVRALREGHRHLDAAGVVV